MLGGAELARQKSEQEQAGQLKALRDCAASEAQTGGLLAELEATRAKIARLRGQATHASERRSDSSPCRTGSGIGRCAQEGRPLPLRPHVRRPGARSDELGRAEPT